MKPGMTRYSERMIDVVVLLALLTFSYLMRAEQPALAGVIVGAAIQFWLVKNASAPHPSLEQAAALAAAQVLDTANQAAVKKGGGV